MRLFRRSKTWMLLSLLATLGVAITPALAFNCCCTALVSSTPAQLAAPNVQPTSVAAAQPSCHSHTAQPVVPEKTEQYHSTKILPAKPDGASLSSIEPVCPCPQFETPPATSTDTTSAFASLGLPAVLPVAHWNLSAPATSAARFLPDGTSGSRGASLSPHAGRAPPTI